jgi:uncharacterized membrane protein YdfJ with MMPL/SSD domain
MPQSPPALARGLQSSAEILAGQTAELADAATLNRRDTTVVGTVVLVVVAIVLGVLLRSLAAPVYLLLTVALNFLATLGLSSFVVQHLL